VIRFCKEEGCSNRLGNKNSHGVCKHCLLEKSKLIIIRRCESCNNKLGNNSSKERTRCCECVDNDRKRCRFCNKVLHYLTIKYDYDACPECRHVPTIDKLCMYCGNKLSWNNNTYICKDCKGRCIFCYKEIGRNELYCMSCSNIISPNWNKGLTKDTDDRLKAISIKTSERNKILYVGEGNPMYGISILDIWTDKYGREKALEMWEQHCNDHLRGENHHHYGEPAYKNAGIGKGGYYNDIWMRSSWELKVAI